MYNLLPEPDHIDQSSMWGQVGSGDRGSGFDDHRVVSSGSWKEYGEYQFLVQIFYIQDCSSSGSST